MINYLILSNLSLILFYLVYKALLQGNTFFKWRRFYLMFSLVFSLSYPFLDYFDSPAISSVPQNIVTQTQNFLQPASIMMNQVDVFAQSSDIAWWKIFYLLIISMFATRLIIRLYALWSLKHKATPEYINGDKIWVSHKAITPFSFFNLIMIDKALLSSPHLRMVLQHEKSHVEQWHSLDVLAAEIVGAVFFYNPFIYLIKKEIRINLEYLADNNCVEHKEEKKAYQTAILQIAVNQPYVSISNHFNYSPIKQRIMMLNKRKSNKIAMLKYIGILPMMFALFLLSQCTKSTKEGAENNLIGDLQMSIKEEKFKMQETIKEVVDFSRIDTPPMFSGGNKVFMNYLASNTKYPEKAKENKVEGRVYIQFVVDSLGKVKDVNVLKASGIVQAQQDTIVWNFANGTIESKLKTSDGLFENMATVTNVAYLLLEEGLRVVKAMPDWKPGKMNNKAVNVKYQVPINFRLSPPALLPSTPKKS